MTQRPIKYNGLYGFSDDGTVTSFRFPQSPRVLKQWPDDDGYMRVFIFPKPKQRIMVVVHRAVAELFVPGQRAGLQVNHKNGIKTDNRAENLEWVTPRQNTIHGWRVLGRKVSQEQRKRMSFINGGDRNSNAKITEGDAREIRLLRKIGLMGKEIAPLYGLSVSHVLNISRGYSRAKRYLYAYEN